MKPLITFLFVCMVLTISCTNKSKDSAQESKSTKTVAIDVKIEGMTCTGCEKTLENIIGKLKGVKSITASHEKAEATVVIYSEIADTTEIRENIDDIGYKTLSIAISE